jgi:hypothetical protein
MSTQPTTKRIRIANPPLDANNKTYLTADVAASATLLEVISTSGKQFLTTGGYDYYLLIEGYEKEKAEFVLVDASDSATDDNSFTISATKYSHEASDPVIYTPYNQIRIYGSLTLAGTKVLIDTIDIDPTEQYTDFIFDDSTYSYFFTAYYNATLDVISAYSEEITSTSLGRTSVKQIIESALKKAMTKIDENPDGKLSWDVAIETVNDGLDEIMVAKKKWEFLHTIDGTTTDTVADTAYIAKPSDVAFLEHLIVNNYKLDWMSRKKYDEYTKSGTTVSSGQPSNFTIKDNKYYLYPTPSAAWDVIYEYFKYPTEITDLTDTVDRPFVAILKLYCAAHFCWIRGNEKRGDKMYTLYQKILIQQIEDYSGPDQLGDAESIEIGIENNLDDCDFLT